MKKNQSYNSKKSSQINSLEEKGFNKIPEFYKSLADTPSLGRLRSIDVGVNIPRIVEIIEESVLLDNTAYVERIIRLEGNHKTIPLIEGILITSDENLYPISFTAETSFYTRVEYLGNNTIKLIIKLFGVVFNNYSNQTVRFKLRVWELGVSLGTNLNVLV